MNCFVIMPFEPEFDGVDTFIKNAVESVTKDMRAFVSMKSVLLAV